MNSLFRRLLLDHGAVVAVWLPLGGGYGRKPRDGRLLGCFPAVRLLQCLFAVQLLEGVLPLVAKTSCRLQGLERI